MLVALLSPGYVLPSHAPARALPVGPMMMAVSPPPLGDMARAAHRRPSTTTHASSTHTLLPVSRSGVRDAHASTSAPALQVGQRTRPKIATDITQLIGNTPLLKLGVTGEGLGATILCKLESMEPCNSVKDRIGYSMITEAERRGDIKPGARTAPATRARPDLSLLRLPRRD